MEIERLYQIYTQYPQISTDSRYIKQDSLFFALKGDNFNGNKFATKALEAGAIYAIVDDEDIAHNNPNCIIVADVLTTLQSLARYHRQQLGIPILAITGTNGKTTTKELVAKVLAKKYSVSLTAGNFNNHIGVPLTLLAMTKDTEFGIVEMGANHINEIAALCKITEPNYGIINNVGKAHLEGFGSVEGVKIAKGEMYDYLNRTEGLAFVNTDDDTLNKMVAQRKGLTVKPYSASQYKVELQASTKEKPFLSFKMNGSLIVRTNLLGEYNLNNILAAVAVGQFANIEMTEIINAIEEYQPQNNRSQLIQKGSNTIYMDAYNANPSSMEVALVNFSKIDAPNKLAILGDMLELGIDSLTEHKKIITLLESLNIDTVYFVGNEFANVSPTHNNTCRLSFLNTEELCEYLKNNEEQNATILLKGSHGIHLEKVLDFL